MNLIKAYMRISSEDENEMQSYKSQDLAIRRWCRENDAVIPEECFFRDDASGNDFDRAGWMELKRGLKAGDTVVMKDILRFAADCGSGFAEYNRLLHDEINVVFIDNPTISTDYIRSLTAAADRQENIPKDKLVKSLPALLFQVEFDRAKKEREQISRRIKDGIAASNKKSGRKTGQIDKLTPELETDIHMYLSDGKVKQIDLMKKHSISRNTLKKYAELIKKQQMP